MISRLYPRADFSMGLQNASSWKLRQPNELEDGRNIRFNEEIGAVVRRNGYVESGAPFSASGKDPVGFHTAQYTTGAKRFVAVPAEDDSSTLVKVQKVDGTWDTIISDLPIGADVYFTDYRDEVYVSGYTVADDLPFQPRNINKELDVSTTRNLLFAPWAKYYVVYRGVLYAANVKVGDAIHPDRFYKGSAPTGAMTFVRGDQDNPYVAATMLNQVPAMTNYTAPFGVVSQSSEVNTSSRGWQAFDRDTGNVRWLSNTTTGWVQYDFGAGNAKIINYYAITGMNDTANNRNPKTWTLQGSNDGSSFTTVHSVTNAPQFSQNETRTYTMNNTTDYRYYRLNITAPQTTTDLVGVKELSLYATLSTDRPLELKIDSARYVKAGMVLDLYKPNGTKLFTITVDSVNKTENTIRFLPKSFNITNANATTDVLTVSNTTDLFTGAQVRFNSSNSLPAPLTADTTYYAIKVTNTTFKVASSYENALIGSAINLTSAGSGTNNAVLGYSLKSNDEIWLQDRYGILTTFWNTDYPTPDRADWSAVQPGADSSIAITGAKESANRLFVFTLNSTTRFDGTNPQQLSTSIGCASMRSIKSMDDDWMVWLTARGRVYARNEAGGQQEYISRGLYNKFFSKLSLEQLKNASSSITDGEYAVYVGDFEGEPHRAVYDFGSNTWSVDALGHPTLMYANDVADGVMKPFFVSDDGKLYQDDTGNRDGDKVTRFQMDIGKTNYGTNNDKFFEGHYIYSKNAIGLKVVIRIDDKEPMIVGEIAADYGDLLYKITGDNRAKYKGSTIAVSLKGAVDGPPQTITSVDDYFNMVQEINAHAKRQ